MNTESILRRVGRAAWLRSISLGLPIFFLALSGLPHSSEAGPCTKGVNCYCDKVRGGSLNDPSILVCEDWEAPTLQNDQSLTIADGNAP